MLTHRIARLTAAIAFALTLALSFAPSAQASDLDPDRDGLTAYDRCPQEWGPVENWGCPTLRLPR